ILNGVMNDECIDFTMIITSRNNASISNFRDGFRWQSEYPWCIIEFSKKSIFLYDCNSKTNHCKYLKFSPNIHVIIYKPLKFFNFYGKFSFEVSIKKIFDDQKNLKILLKVPYELFIFHNFLISVYSSNFYEICRNRKTLQVKKFNTIFSISFPSSRYGENSKHHYRKNFKCY
ncbi:hypothetical protein AGLY_004500, partial [Aphis glycines]